MDELPYHLGVYELVVGKKNKLNVTVQDNHNYGGHAEPSGNICSYVVIDVQPQVPGQEETLICSIGQFPWCPCFHFSRFQATILLLHTAGKRGTHSALSQL